MEQRRKILSLRYSGYTTEDIAGIVGVSPAVVQRCIDSAMAAQADEIRVAVIREAEMTKLEEMEATYLPSAIDGDIRAAAFVLKLMERRAALVGIDKQTPAGSTVVNLVQILSSMPSTVPLPVPNPLRVIDHA